MSEASFSGDGLAFIFTFFGSERLGIYKISEDKPIPLLAKGSADFSPEALKSATANVKDPPSSSMMKNLGGGGDPKLHAMLHQVKNSASLAASNAGMAAAAQTRVAMEAGQRLVDALEDDITELTKEIEEHSEDDAALSEMQMELADLKDQRRKAKKQRRDFAAAVAVAPAAFSAAPADKPFTVSPNDAASTAFAAPAVAPVAAAPTAAAPPAAVAATPTKAQAAALAMPVATHA